MTGHRTRIGALDWTRPYGITRPDCPPDDEQTDVAAWLAGRFDSLAAGIESVCVGGADSMAVSTAAAVESATAGGGS